MKKNNLIGPLTKKQIFEDFLKKNLKENYIVYRGTGDSRFLNKIDKENGIRLMEIGMQYFKQSEKGEIIGDDDGNLIDENNPSNKWDDDSKNKKTNLYSYFQDKKYESRRKTSWMYDDRDNNTQNNKNTITNIDHPFYGSYKDLANKEECMDTNGFCQKGLYPNGKKCVYEETTWGFEDKNVCYPLSCKDNYNPNKRCKIEYKNKDIPKCYNDHPCNPKGTLTKAPIIGNDQSNYVKTFLFKDKATNFDGHYPKNRTSCQCKCKKNYYGVSCNKLYTKDNICDGATDTKYCNASKVKTEIDTVVFDKWLLINITITIIIVLVVFTMLYFGLFQKAIETVGQIKNGIVKKAGDIKAKLTT